MTGKRKTAAAPAGDAAAAPNGDAAATPTGEASGGDQAEAGRVIKVTAVSDKGRWRIGRFFTREVTEIDADELSDEEVERLVGDPHLIVDLGETGAG